MGMSFRSRAVEWLHEQAESLREDAVARSLVLKRRGDPELGRIVSFTAAKYGTVFAGLSIITGRRQILLSNVGTDIVETARDDSFCTTTIQRPGEPLVVPDARDDPRFARLATVAGEPFVRFYAGVPIVDQNGYALGALCVADRTPRTSRFDPTELFIRGREVERLLRW